MRLKETPPKYQHGSDDAYGIAGISLLRVNSGDLLFPSIGENKQGSVWLPQ